MLKEAYSWRHESADACFECKQLISRYSHSV